MKEYRLRVKEKIMKADLATIRREYTKGGLKRSDLPDNPLVLFTKWLQEAIDAEVNEPTAMPNVIRNCRYSISLLFATKTLGTLSSPMPMKAQSLMSQPLEKLFIA